MKRLAKRLLPERVKKPLRRRMDPHVECPLPGGKSYLRISGELPPYCYPLEDPEWVRAEDATYVVPDDAILGFEIDGQAHAMPWDVMAAHHVANLELAGRPYVLTLCDACVGGGLYDAEVDGRRLRFRNEGQYGGTPYAVDKETGSLWTMVTMRPLHGPAMAHGGLQRHPVVHATWSEWSQLHPDTLVVNDPGEPEDGHGADHRWPGHAHLPPFMGRRLAPEDDRLAPGDLVLGVETDDEARAYPLELLQEHGGLVNDVVGGKPIVAISLPGTYLAISFHRELDGEVLELAWLDEPALDDSPQLVDRQTGSSWDLFGRCADGALAGAQLRHAWGGLQKWFNWSNLAAGCSIWHPDAQ